jgi:hypothetical protein
MHKLWIAFYRDLQDTILGLTTTTPTNAYVRAINTVKPPQYDGEKKVQLTSFRSYGRQPYKPGRTTSKGEAEG